MASYIVKSIAARNPKVAASLEHLVGEVGKLTGNAYHGFQLVFTVGGEKERHSMCLFNVRKVNKEEQGA